MVSPMFTLTHQRRSLLLQITSNYHQRSLLLQSSTWPRRAFLQEGSRTLIGRVDYLPYCRYNLSSNWTHFLRFYQPFNICTSIWVTHDVWLYYSLFEVWATCCYTTLHMRGCGTARKFVHVTLSWQVVTGHALPIACRSDFITHRACVIITTHSCAYQRLERKRDCGYHSCGSQQIYIASCGRLPISEAIWNLIQRWS